MTKKNKTIEQLQEEHSEMLATAADLGMKVPEDMTAEFDTAEAGAVTCSNLDALIRKFREGLDEGGETKKVVAEDDVKKEDAEVEEVKSKVTAPKKGAVTKKKTTKSTEAAPAKAAETSGEDQMAKTAKKAPAKKAAKKKAPAKKAAKKAGGKAAAAKGSNGGGGTRFAEDATIKWGAGKKNPAREGAGRYDRIEQVMKASGKTVKAFVASGGNPTTLRNCVNAKLCSVS